MDGRKMWYATKIGGGVDELDKSARASLAREVRAASSRVAGQIADAKHFTTLRG